MAYPFIHSLIQQIYIEHHLCARPCISQAFVFPESDNVIWVNEWTNESGDTSQSYITLLVQSPSRVVYVRGKIEKYKKLTGLERFLFVSHSPLIPDFNPGRALGYLLLSSCLVLMLSLSLLLQAQKAFPFPSVRNCSYVISIFWGHGTQFHGLICVFYYCCCCLFVSLNLHHAEFRTHKNKTKSYNKHSCTYHTSPNNHQPRANPTPSTPSSTTPF